MSVQSSDEQKKTKFTTEFGFWRKVKYTKFFQYCLKCDSFPKTCRNNKNNQLIDSDEITHF